MIIPQLGFGTMDLAPTRDNSPESHEVTAKGVQAAIAAIEQDPTRYQAVGSDIRVFRMKRLPYYLFYHYDQASTAIIIYAVAHHKRRPGYWRDRLSA